MQHVAISGNGRARVKVNALGHGRYEFSNRRADRRLAIPFIRYNGVPYRIHYDARPIQMHYDSHDLMVLRHVRPGKHTIEIQPQPNKAEQIAKAMTIVGILAYLWILIRWIIRKTKVNL